VNVVRIKQSAAFASGPNKYQRSFGEKYFVNYSLLKFYGVLNEHNSALTGFSEEDAQELFEAMWNGTKNLMTSSKFGHMPRLLLRVEYNEPNYFIGELDSLIRLATKDNKTEESILSPLDYVVDVEELMASLLDVKEKIGRVQIKYDKRLSLSQPITESLQSARIEVEPFAFSR
ncbi:MAG: type I CRISPR-associated protein Cas7, partial [Nitrososphaerales archaeon]